MTPKKPDNARLDKIVADARRPGAQGYRDLALKMYPWVCGRCAREFTPKTVQLLEVHHRDHNHDNNPLDGSNWELLCTYCHENEHRRHLDGTAGRGAGGEAKPQATHRPFDQLEALLKKKTEK